MKNHNIKIEFDAKKHRYTVNDEIFPSVTQVLSIIDKSYALINWAAKTTVGYIQDNLEERSGKIFVGDLELNLENAGKIFYQAKREHRRIKEEAGDIGTKAHEEVEKIIKTGIEPTEKILGEMDDRIANAVLSYIKWAAENEFVPLHAEKRICLMEPQVAGTVDCVGMLNGLHTLLDLKTSKAIYPEMRLQVAAYAKGWEETYDEFIADVRILRIGKENVEFEVVKVNDIPELYSVFLACVPIYRWIKENKKW